MAKPTGTDLNTTWGESANASVLEPSGAKQGILFQGDERPAAQYFNWFLRTVSRWLRYLNEFETLAHFWDAAQIFRGVAGDDNAAVIVQPASITTRKLVFEMAAGSAIKVRFYRVGANGRWEVTYNAAWRASDSKWVADSNTIGARADSAKLVWSDTGLAIYRPATSVGSAVWNEADWEKITWGPDDAQWRVIAPSTGSTGSNPACTQGSKNTLKAANIPKAWGVLRKLYGVDSPIDMLDGFNVSNAPGKLLDYVQVDFVTPMADENYAVVIGAGELPTGGVQLRVTDKVAGHFHVSWLDASGNPVDLDATGWKFDFVVFGKQTD